MEVKNRIYFQSFKCLSRQNQNFCTNKENIICIYAASAAPFTLLSRPRRDTSALSGDARYKYSRARLVSWVRSRWRRGTDRVSSAQSPLRQGICRRRVSSQARAHLSHTPGTVGWCVTGRRRELPCRHRRIARNCWDPNHPVPRQELLYGAPGPAPGTAVSSRVEP